VSYLSSSLCSHHFYDAVLSAPAMATCPTYCSIPLRLLLDHVIFYWGTSGILWSDILRRLRLGMTESAADRFTSLPPVWISGLACGRRPQHLSLSQPGLGSRVRSYLSVRRARLISKVCYGTLRAASFCFCSSFSTTKAFG